MYTILQKNSYKFYILILYLLILFHNWGSYSDHKNWDLIYSGDYGYFFIGPIFDSLIRFFNFLNLSSEFFWKFISLINAGSIIYFSKKLLLTFENKQKYDLTLLLFVIFIAIPCSIYNLRAGLGINFFIISFYYSIKNKNIFSNIYLLLSILSHIQLLVPTFFLILYRLVSNYKLFLYNFLNSKSYVLKVIFIFILITSILIIKSNFVVEYYYKFVEYLNLYVLNIKLYSLELIIYNLLSSIYYLILVLPFLRNNTYMKSRKIKFSSTQPSIFLTLLVIPKIIFQPIFTISRVFSSFNFIFILAFYQTLYISDKKIINQIYNFFIIFGALLSLIRYLSFYRINI